jgi:hypothetical protein
VEVEAQGAQHLGALVGICDVREGRRKALVVDRGAAARAGLDEYRALPRRLSGAAGQSARGRSSLVRGAAWHGVAIRLALAGVE